MDAEPYTLALQDFVRGLDKLHIRVQVEERAPRTVVHNPRPRALQLLLVKLE